MEGEQSGYESDGNIEKKTRKPYVMTDARKQAFEKCRAKRAEYCEQVRTAKKLGKLDAKEEAIKETKEKIEAGEVKVPPIARPAKKRQDSVIELTEEQRQEALAEYMKNRKISKLTKVESPPSSPSSPEPSPPKLTHKKKKKTVVIEESSSSESSESSVEVVVRKKSKAKPKSEPVQQESEEVRPVYSGSPKINYTFL
jgi:hypothetical protein